MLKNCCASTSLAAFSFSSSSSDTDESTRSFDVVENGSTVAKTNGHLFDWSTSINNKPIIICMRIKIAVGTMCF